MLTVDLGQLDRKGRLRIDSVVAAVDPMWAGAGVPLSGNIEVRLRVQRAGHDVWVRGRFRGVASLPCRRCLRELELPVEEEVTFFYRPGLSELEAEVQEVYPLAVGAREVDLTAALREHVILAVPQFAECRPACRGLCAHCGRELGAAPCRCRTEEPDPRWAALRRSGN